MNASFLLPQSTQEVAQVIGLDLAHTLSGKAWAGAAGRRVAVLYVPQRPRGKCWDKLVSMAGVEVAEKLVAAFGGSDLRFHPSSSFVNRVRDDSIRQYWRSSSLPATWIAWLHDLTERQVRNICKGMPRLAPVRSQPAPPRGE